MSNSDIVRFRLFRLAVPYWSWPWPRFHIPLIEPDWRLSRIRLSDKTSRLRPRLVAPSRSQAYEPTQMGELFGQGPAMQGGGLIERTWLLLDDR